MPASGRLELIEDGRLDLRSDADLLSFSTGIFLAAFCSAPGTSCDGPNVAIVALVVGEPIRAIGTLLGLLLANERWEELPVGSLSVAAERGGVAPRLSF